MEALKFADSHNMIAYLEKSTENADFDEIVDFLTASPIRHALTTIVIIESSVRRDLHFDDEDGITCLTNTDIFENLQLMGYEKLSDKLTFQKSFFSPQWNQIENLEAVFNDEYDTPSHTKKVFANMRRQGKDFSGTVTPLFPSMLASQVVEGEGSGQPSEPQHIPTTASPSHPMKTVHSGEGRDNVLERAATSSGPRHQDTILGDRPAQTRFERLSKQSNDPPLSRVNTLWKVCEDKYYLLLLHHLMLYQSLLLHHHHTPKRPTNIVKPKVRLESSAKKSLGDQEDTSKQGRNGIDQDEEISWFQEDAKTQGSAPVTTAGVSVSTVEPSTPPTTTILIEDKDLTIAQTLMKMRSVKSKEKSKEKGVSSETTIRPTRGVIMKEASEIEPEKPVKVKGKDQIAFKEEVARRLEAQMQAEYEEEERVARQR
ncbi:hypothetical protein Tco_1270435 [Tanacetum coccineum]